MTAETATRSSAAAAARAWGRSEAPAAGMADRWVAIMGGTALGLVGLRRGDWVGMAMAVAGGSLAAAGAAGVPVLEPVRRIDPAALLPDLDRSPTTTQAVVSIRCTVEEAFRHWRNFGNLPKLMDHLDEVEIESATRSVWKARGPGGVPVVWESEIDGERENELISWHTLEGADLPHRGSVMFRPAPGGRGTEVRLTIAYHPPAGQGGRAVAALFGSTPQQQSREALRRLKQILEVGGRPTIDGQPRGHRGAREVIE